MPLCTCTSVPMSRSRKSMAPRSSRPRTSGFCSVPRSRARTCALPCASVTASGATNASRRALTSPSTSAWMFSGAKPGPSVACPASFIVEPSTVTARSWTPTPPLIQREPARADDDVAVEVLRAQADGVGDRHLAAQVGLVQRAARLQLDAQIAGQPLERAGGAEERLQQLEVQVARQAARDRLAVQPPGDDQIAAVGLEVRLVEHRSRSPLTLTCSGRAASTRTRWTVVSPFAPSTARATDSHSSGSSTSSASGRAGSMSTVTRPLTMPRASPNATSSGASASISTRRKSISACTVGPLGVSAACASTSKRSNSRP